MRLLKNLSVLLATTFIFSSCAQNIVIDYKSPKGGTVVLKPTKVIERAYVVFNDSIIVNQEKTKSITILNAPGGENKFLVTSDYQFYKGGLSTVLAVTVDPGKTQTSVIVVPPYNAGYYVSIVGAVALGAVVGKAVTTGF